MTFFLSVLLVFSFFLSEREAEDPSLSLTIKQKENIHESLETYTTAESLSDVHCDKCNKKTSKNRRDVLGNLPNTLVVHLKVPFFYYLTVRLIYYVLFAKF